MLSVSEQVEKYIEKVRRLREDDPLYNVAAWAEAALDVDASTEDVFEAADLLADITDFKALVDQLSKAVNEQVEIRNRILYELMVEKEMQSLDRRGVKLYLTKTSYVQARKEVGGLSNPNLVSWLDDHNLGGIAKKTINAQTLRGTINTWLEDNPIEVVEDGEFLEGQELYDALGLKPIEDPDSGTIVTEEEQLEQRRQDHERLNELVLITEKPYVGVKGS